MDVSLISALAQYEGLLLTRQELSDYIRLFNEFEMPISKRKKLLLEDLGELKRFGNFIKEMDKENLTKEDIEDIEYIRQRIMSSLKVPKEFFGKDDDDIVGVKSMEIKKGKDE